MASKRRITLWLLFAFPIGLVLCGTGLAQDSGPAEPTVAVEVTDVPVQEDDEIDGIDDEIGGIDDEIGGIDAPQEDDGIGGIDDETGEAGDTDAPWIADDTWRIGENDDLDRADVRPAFVSPRRETLWGRFATTFRGRASRTDEDLDLYGSLSLNYGDPEEDEWYGASMLRILSSLADTSLGTTGTLPDANAGYTQDTRLLVYFAYATWRPEADGARVTLGRQESHVRHGPIFDGATVAYEFDRRWRGALFGGVPFYPYGEYQIEDYLVGGRVTFLPTPRVKLELEPLFLHDQGVDGAPTFQDLRVALRGAYRADTWNARAEFITLDDAFQEVRLRAHATFPDVGVTLQAAYTGGFNPYDDFSIEFAEFSAIIGRLEPYHEVTASVTYDLNAAERDDEDDEYLLIGTVHWRVLEQQRDAGTFNHSFFRSSAGFTVRNPGELRGLWASVFVNFINAEGNGEFYTFTGEVGYEQKRAFRISLGTTYDLYRYDRLTIDEQERVQSYFVAGRVWLTDDAALRLTYEYQITDDDRLHAVRAGASVTF